MRLVAQNRHLLPNLMALHSTHTSLRTSCLTRGAGWPNALRKASSYFLNTKLGSRADNSWDNTSHVRTICSLYQQKNILHSEITPTNTWQNLRHNWSKENYITGLSCYLFHKKHIKILYGTRLSQLYQQHTCYMFGSSWFKFQQKRPHSLPVVDTLQIDSYIFSYWLKYYSERNCYHLCTVAQHFCSTYGPIQYIQNGI